MYYPAYRALSKNAISFMKPCEISIKHNFKPAVVTRKRPSNYKGASRTKDPLLTQIKHMTGQKLQAQTFPSCIYSGMENQGPLTPFELIIELKPLLQAL